MSEPQIAGIPLSQKTETLNFKDCTLSKLDKIFGLQEVTESQILEEWLTKEQRNELERRIADYYSSPDDGFSWEDVKNRIRSRSKKLSKCPRKLAWD
jgi:putative addiction module component (TIGR02574 family)